MNEKLLVILVSLAALFLIGNIYSFTGKVIDEGYSCGNYSLNIPVNASASSISGNYKAGLSIDGNTTSHWSSLSGNQHWIYYDLGEKKCVNSIQLYTASGFLPLTMNLQVSDGAQTWSSIGSSFTISQGGTFVKKTFNETSGRYLRLLFTQGVGIGGSGSSSGGSGGSSSFYASLSEVIVNSSYLIPINNSNLTLINQSIFCNDTDGKNFTNLGTVNFSNSLFRDFCSSDNNLTEYSCTANNLTIENFTCGYRCLNGACLNNLSEISDETFDFIDLSEEGFNNSTVQLKLGQQYYLNFDPFLYVIGVSNLTSQSAAILFLDDEEAYGFVVNSTLYFDLNLDGDSDTSIGLLGVNLSNNITSFLFSKYESDDEDSESFQPGANGGDSSLSGNNQVGDGSGLDDFSENEENSESYSEEGNVSSSSKFSFSSLNKNVKFLLIFAIVAAFACIFFIARIILSRDDEIK